VAFLLNMIAWLYKFIDIVLTHHILYTVSEVYLADI